MLLHSALKKVVCVLITSFTIALPTPLQMSSVSLDKQQGSNLKTPVSQDIQLSVSISPKTSSEHKETKTGSQSHLKEQTTNIGGKNTYIRSARASVIPSLDQSDESIGTSDTIVTGLCPQDAFTVGSFSSSKSSPPLHNITRNSIYTIFKGIAVSISATILPRLSRATNDIRNQYPFGSIYLRRADLPDIAPQLVILNSTGNIEESVLNVTTYLFYAYKSLEPMSTVTNKTCRRILFGDFDNFTRIDLDHLLSDIRNEVFCKAIMIDGKVRVSRALPSNCAGIDLKMRLVALENNLRKLTSFFKYFEIIRSENSNPVFG